MADIHHLLLGIVVLAMMSVSTVHSQDEDGCDEFTAAVKTCIEPYARPPPDMDIPTMCRFYANMSACMAAVPECDNPPADSKYWMQIWEQINGMAGPLCTSTPGDTSCENFESQAVTCVMPLIDELGPGSDLNKVCAAFNEAKSCMGPLMSRCPEEAKNSKMVQGWESTRKELEKAPC